jgi:DNA-binding transcriptional MerR regulator
VTVRTDEGVDAKLYRSISEVSELVGVKPHVLRYWETQFSMLRPRKNRAGNRMYRPDEVRLLLRIREYLYDRRYTIAGARRKLLEERRDAAAATPDAPVASAEAERRATVREIGAELRQLLKELRRHA